MPEFTPENVASGNVVADNVPVITPGQSVTNTVAIGGFTMTILLMAANWLDVPITEDGINILLAATNIIATIVVWARNRWFRNAVVSTSVPDTVSPATKASRYGEAYRGQDIRLRRVA